MAFERAVKTIRGLTHGLIDTAAPLYDLSKGISDIEADRKTIASKAFDTIDVLLLPTTTTTVPSVKDSAKDATSLSPENTAFANYYGLPAISVPCGFDRNGLPLGLQIVGKPWDENAVLQLARQYETASRLSQLTSIHSLKHLHSDS